LVLIAWLLRLGNPIRQRYRVVIAAGQVITFTFLSLSLLGPIGAIPKAQWVSPATWIVVTSIVIPIYGGALAIATLAWALPNRRSWPAASAGEGASQKGSEGAQEPV
jgi:hypothetical protein